MEIDAATASTIIITVCLAGFLAAIIYAMVREDNRRKEAFEGLRAFLPGDTGDGGFFSHPSFHGTYKGARLDITYHPGSKHTPARLELFLEAPDIGADLRVYGESLFGSLLDSVGLSFDLATGHPDFDAAYSLASSDSAAALAYLARGGVKEAVDFLFRRGAGSLELLPGDERTHGALRLVLEAGNLARRLDRTELLPVLEALHGLRRGAAGAAEPA